jgi:hypothetical protein
MFKKILILSTFLFTLVSCGSDDTSLTVEANGLTTFEWTGYSISIPGNWDVMNDKNNILPEPSQWKIELSVQSSQPKWGFLNNLLILSDTLKTFTNSTEYSMANNVWARREYIDYLALENKEFTFLDDSKSQLYVFEAKYNLETPKLKFLQTAYVCNPDKGYFLTIAISPSIKKIDKYETLLSTFSCNPGKDLDEL